MAFVSDMLILVERSFKECFEALLSLSTVVPTLNFAISSWKYLPLGTPFRSFCQNSEDSIDILNNYKLCKVKNHIILHYTANLFTKVITCFFVIFHKWWKILKKIFTCYGYFGYIFFAISFNWQLFHVEIVDLFLWKDGCRTFTVQQSATLNNTLNMFIWCSITVQFFCHHHLI